MLSWQEWLNLNYKTIQLWARKWHHEEWRELIAHMTFYLRKNWSKFSQIPDGEERIKFLQTWMKNNVKWKNSDFNKSIAVNNLNETFLDESDEHFYYEQYDIIAEDLGQDVKDFIIDLDRRFSEIETNKIVLVRKIYLTLPSHQKVLYDLYFTQMLSIRLVAKKLQLPPSAVYGMINELKKEILSRC